MLRSGPITGIGGGCSAPGVRAAPDAGGTVVSSAASPPHPASASAVTPATAIRESVTRSII
jgi:hypothetical protein